MTFCEKFLRKSCSMRIWRGELKFDGPRQEPVRKFIGKCRSEATWGTAGGGGGQRGPRGWEAGRGGNRLRVDNIVENFAQRCTKWGGRKGCRIPQSLAIWSFHKHQCWPKRRSMIITVTPNEILVFQGKEETLVKFTRGRGVTSQRDPRFILNEQRWWLMMIFYWWW